jgi:hypothetical protein|nr:MAG TPA: portal [Caudoviricetes sp.]
MNIFGYNISVRRGRTPPIQQEREVRKPSITGVEPGRISVPDDGNGSTSLVLTDFIKTVNPSFRVEIIKLIRDLYKVNPDVGKALQDMFQLTNTGHRVEFPNNTDKEADMMRDHLADSTKRWSNCMAGIDGYVNKMAVQLLVSGALSIEGVPNSKLDGLSTIVFVKPDNIVFKRENDGVYQPYQKNLNQTDPDKAFIKLNTRTYKYVGYMNDTDEPYGIPPFMSALDSLKTQSDMKVNLKHIMENAGLLGFMEALMEKPDIQPNENVPKYQARLDRELKKMKVRLKEGMKDGLVVGYKDDHEFKLNSTTKDMANLDVPWTMNQQSVANGLGINSSIIGVTTANTEGGAGVSLSTLLAQLKNIQRTIGYVLEFLYNLELTLAGFNPKGITITWYPATVSDDVKIQQANQYKVQNLNALYRDGIISLQQYAQAMGYDTPDQAEPRVPIDKQVGNGKQLIDGDEDKNTKNKSARRQRDKSKINPKRGDQNVKTR